MFTEFTLSILNPRWTQQSLSSSTVYIVSSLVREGWFGYACNHYVEAVGFYLKKKKSNVFVSLIHIFKRIFSRRSALILILNLEKILMSIPVIWIHILTKSTIILYIEAKNVFLISPCSWGLSSEMATEKIIEWDSWKSLELPISKFLVTWEKIHL